MESDKNIALMDASDELRRVDESLARVAAYGADIDPDTGELLSEETDESLAIRRGEICGGLLSKAEEMRAGAAEIDAQIESLKAAIDSLKSSRDSLIAEAETIEGPIIRSVQDNGEVSTGTYTICVHKNPPSVVEVNATLTPKEYMRTTTPKPVTKPDRAKIKAAILSGEHVPGWGVLHGVKLVCKEVRNG